MKACLGFDTSCYTTSVALATISMASDASVETGSQLYFQNRKLLEVPIGAQGLRQSDALFQHVKCLPSLVEELVADHPELKIVSICASVRPRPQSDSYMPVFRAGESCARTAAAALRVPFFATTHQQGHIRAALVGTDLPASNDFLALHLSGGTTEMLCVHGEKPHFIAERLTLLGGTKDLHAGQLIDRVGVCMQLPFPAGPSLEMLASQGRAESRLSVSVQGCDCHFSGAETQAMRLLDAGILSREDIAAEVFSCIARTVAQLLLAGCESTGMTSVLLGGGVASSTWIRNAVIRIVAKRNQLVKLYFGKPELSGDNAVGVAALGAEQYWQSVCNEQLF